MWKYYDYMSTKQQEIIIVLAKGVNEDGTLTKESIGNVEKATEVHRITQDKIIMCGRWSYTYTYTPKKTEAEAMKAYAITLGVEEKSIIIEDQSSDTLGNAFFAKKIIEKFDDINSIIVIAIDHHINRSKYIFGKVFGNRYDMKFIGVNSKSSADFFAKKQQLEDETLSFLKRILDDVTPGNDLELQNVFDKVHPLYAKTQTTVPEWVWNVFESKGVTRKSIVDRYYKKRSKSELGTLPKLKKFERDKQDR